MKRDSHRIALVCAYVLLIYVGTFVITMGGFLEDKGIASHVFTWAYVALAAILLSWGIARFGRNSYAWLYLAIIAALLITAALNLPEPRDRLHFLEYGLLFILLHRALGPAAPRPVAYGLTLVGTFAIGLTDEALQSFYPDGVMDFGDAMNNAFAGYLAAGVVLVWERC